MIVYTLVTSYTDRTNRTTVESIRTFGEAEGAKKCAADFVSEYNLRWTYYGNLDGRNSLTSSGGTASKWESAGGMGVSFDLYETEVE